MMKVYMQSNSHAQALALFDNEDCYSPQMILELDRQAEHGNMTITESVNSDGCVLGLDDVFALLERIGELGLSMTQLTEMLDEKKASMPEPEPEPPSVKHTYTCSVCKRDHQSTDGNRDGTPCRWCNEGNWKLVVPDEQVVTVKAKTCECGTEMAFEEGQAGSFHEPTIDAMYHCPECGLDAEVTDDDIVVETATKSELEDKLC